jgi:hypothetical protein
MKGALRIALALSLLLLAACAIGVGGGDEHDSESIQRQKELRRMRDTAATEEERKYYDTLLDPDFGGPAPKGVLFIFWDSYWDTGDEYEYDVDEGYLKPPEDGPVQETAPAPQPEKEEE